MKELISRNLG